MHLLSFFLRSSYSVFKSVQCSMFGESLYISNKDLMRYLFTTSRPCDCNYDVVDVVWIFKRWFHRCKLAISRLHVPFHAAKIPFVHCYCARARNLEEDTRSLKHVCRSYQIFNSELLYFAFAIRLTILVIYLISLSDEFAMCRTHEFL